MRKTVIKFFTWGVQEVCVRMQSNPVHEILPGLWLGNRIISQDRNWLQQNQIGAIFNCSKDLPFVQGLPIHLYRVPVDDNLQEEEIRNLQHWSWEIVFKIHKERNDETRILIHCAAGMQRSAAVTAMFLISQYRCTTDEAIAYIKHKRPIAFYGNANFYTSIKQFETGFRTMISKTDSYAKYPRIPLPMF
jgi:rhodanese-related sulfurtransferase